MKVLHVLANSPPDVNGYAIRTQKILSNQSNELVGLTSPWYPDRESMAESHQIDNVNYLRTIHPVWKNKNRFSHKLVKFFTRKTNNSSQPKASLSESKKFLPLRVFDFFYYGIFKVGRAIRHFFRIGWKVVEEKILIKYFMKRIIEIAKQEKAELIHAHTPYRVGLPALRAARKLKLPFVYEMRGMWEETAVANGRWKANGPAYRRFQNYETKVLRFADAVVCISETLKQEAISRGVDEAKITVVTNAVDESIINQSTKHELFDEVSDLLNRDKSTKVIGYIGSLREMEGVDLTAEATAKLSSKGHDVRFFVLSSNSGQSELKDYCDKLGLGDKAVIAGPVPHDSVAQFYDLIDIFVVSRPNSRVTRLVTPLKPFEAMAMKKAVVASKLPALEEIIDDGTTGLLYHADDVDSLVENIERVLSDGDLINSLGDNAHKWIIENRTWQSVVQNYSKAYQTAKENKR
tara:strand:- start:1050 stop:2438 length:1389 start_codon:yes stop_codon:yes gene_type:complete